jgi:predicted RND superfamily exporter protein
MIRSSIVRVVNFCAHRRWAIIIAGTLLIVAAAIFDAARFSINTDLEELISEDLPWHQREIALSKAFPQKDMIAVVKAPSAEDAEQATNVLAQALSRQSDLFPLVEQPDSGDFFERNGLLFKPLAEVWKSAEGFTRIQSSLRR